MRGLGLGKDMLVVRSLARLPEPAASCDVHIEPLDRHRNSGSVPGDTRRAIAGRSADGRAKAKQLVSSTSELSSSCLFMGGQRVAALISRSAWARKSGPQHGSRSDLTESDHGRDAFSAGLLALKHVGHLLISGLSSADKTPGRASLSISEHAMAYA
ncbi:hypothetical protein VDGL01_10290 [Verticillium dahliae]